jgi:hypothetical protein
MIATVRELKGFITVFLAVVLNAGARAYRGPYQARRVVSLIGR